MIDSIGSAAAIVGFVLMCAATPTAIVAYVLTRPRNRSLRGMFWFDAVILVLEATLLALIFLPLLTQPNSHEGGEVLIPFFITILSVPFLCLAAFLRWFIFRPKNRTPLYE
jgi:hypothetical protein